MLPAQNYVAAFNNTFSYKPGGGTSASFTFWFSVDGPTSPNTIIPMQIAFTTWIEGAGAYAADSVISWPNLGPQGDLPPESQGQRAAFCAANINMTNLCTNNAVTQIQYTHYAKEKNDFYVLPNTAYAISMSADANTLTYGVTTNNIPSSYSYAIVDPNISINPTFANANSYSLQFSAGVKNGSPVSVPEPSTFLLLGGGLLGLGFVRRLMKPRKGFARSQGETHSALGIASSP